MVAEIILINKILCAAAVFACILSAYFINDRFAKTITLLFSIAPAQWFFYLNDLSYYEKGIYFFLFTLFVYVAFSTKSYNKKIVSFGLLSVFFAIMAAIGGVNGLGEQHAILMANLLFYPTFINEIIRSGKDEIHETRRGKSKV